MFGQSIFLHIILQTFHMYMYTYLYTSITMNHYEHYYVHIQVIHVQPLITFLCILVTSAEGLSHRSYGIPNSTFTPLSLQNIDVWLFIYGKKFDVSLIYLWKKTLLFCFCSLQFKRLLSAYIITVKHSFRDFLLICKYIIICSFQIIHTSSLH